MKDIIFTIDNVFRNPLRWGRCPIKTGATKIFGFTFKMRNLDEYIKPQWVLTFYFYKWFRAYSNYPLNV